MHCRRRVELRRGATVTTLAQCRSCPRLVHHLKRMAEAHPDWHNAPVPGLGPVDAPLLILGLAPGRLGANRTGIPFVGDRSAVWLQERLTERGCMSVQGQPQGIRISNAVKCLPPGNKPSTREIKMCTKKWLRHELGPPKVVFALGRIAHDAVLRCVGLPLTKHPFAHGAAHQVGELHLVDSFHPSPLNTQTGRLSAEQFLVALDRAIKLTVGGP